MASIASRLDARELDGASAPDDGALLTRRVIRAADVERARARSVPLRHEMHRAGLSLIASSWRTTRGGVTLELVFAPR